VKDLKRILIVCVALVLILSSALVACTTPAEQEEEEEEEEDNILQIGYWPDATGNLGCPTQAMSGHAFLQAQTCLELLVRIDEEGNLAPGLATDWALDPTAKTITFTLRQGVKFHDGADWNAEAAKWNLDKIDSADLTTLGKNIASVDISDTYTIVLTLNMWDSTVLDVLAGIDREGLMISPLSGQAHDDEWCKMNPVGTGPFKFVSWEPEVKQVYEKFDDYWQEGKPALDGVEFIFIADPLTRALALEAGEVDVALVEVNDAKMLEAKGTYTIQTSPGGGFIGIAGDSINPDSPFADIRVRQAVEYAIDKEAICDNIGMGYWTPVCKQAKPGSWADDPAVVGLSYNPTKAIELLDDAGYSGGLDISIYTPSTAPYLDLMTAIQGYLAAVGIHATMELYDYNGWVSNVVFGGWVNGLTGLSATPEETLSLNSMYGPVSMFVWPSRKSLPEVVALINAAMAAPDVPTKQELTRQAIAETVPEAVNTWIALANRISASPPDVHHDICGNPAHPIQWTPADAWIG